MRSQALNLGKPSSRQLIILALLAALLAAFGVCPTAAQTDATDPAQTPSPQVVDLPNPDQFLDVDWYHNTILRAADRWNSGLDGQSGMGAYKDGFDGFFRVNLDRQWRQMPIRFSTSVAQSRAIYMNVEAYRAAGPEYGGRFLAAAEEGARFLLDHFRDPEYGGYFWAVSPRGTVADSQKQGYGNVHPILALAQLYAVTQNQNYLDAALEQVGVIRQHYADPAYPLALLPGFNRDFTEVMGVNNIDNYTHYFEALLALYDVTTGDQQAQIADLIAQHGDFLVNQLYHDQDGFSDRGYVAYNYDENWQPSQEPYTRQTQWSGARQASTGHNIELAYLLSRAVERGFNPDWLHTAEKLIKFCLEYAVDDVYGGMLYEITDYDGQPLPGNPDNTLYIWWAQAETARALLHFTVVRGDDYADKFKAVETLFHQDLTDQDYGGLYYSLDSTRGLEPTGTGKGDIWKTNYHFSMFFAEVLRLAQQYPDQVAALNAAVLGA